MPEYQVDVTGPDGTKTSLTVTTPGNGGKSESSVAAAAIAANHSANTAARNNTVQTNKTQTGTEVKQQVAAANEVVAVNEAADIDAPPAATTSKAQKAPKAPRPKSASKSAQKLNPAAQAKAISAATPAVIPEVKTLELNELNNTIDALLTTYKLDPKDSAHIAVKRIKKAISQMKTQDDIDLINTKLGHIISQHNEGPNKIAYESLLSNLTKMGNNTEFPNLLEELKTVSLSNQLGGRRKLRTARKQRKQHKQHTQRKQRK